MGLTPTIIPNTWNPVNAEIWFSATASNSDLSGFKYIYTLNKIDKITGATTSLGIYKLPPRPDTSEGLFTPHKLLRSELSYDLAPFITTVNPATNSVIKYNLTYGYEEDTSIRYTNLQMATAPLAGHLLLDIPQVGLGFQNNDIITMAPDAPTFFDTSNNIQTYTGTHSVIDIVEAFGATFLALDTLFITASVTPTYTPGTITKLQRLNAAQSANYYGFNGTRQYEQIGVNFGSNYLTTTSNNGAALTNYTEFKSVYVNNYETIHFLLDAPSFSSPSTHVWKINYNFYDSTGALYATNTLNIATDVNMKMYMAPAGPQNLIDAGIRSDFDNIDHYSVALQYTDAFVPYNKWVKKFKLVDNCSPYPDNFRLAFQNRNGGFEYWNFNYRSTNTLTTSSTEWRKNLPYNYTIGDRQDSVLANKAVETWTISSDWITAYDSSFLKEAVSTLEAFIVDETNKVFYPIILNADTYVVKTSIDNKLFAVSLNFKYAYDLNLQQN